jgi:hypothetical protein
MHFGFVYMSGLAIKKAFKGCVTPTKCAASFASLARFHLWHSQQCLNALKFSSGHPVGCLYHSPLIKHLGNIILSQKQTSE